MSRNPLPDRRALLTGTDILVIYRDPVIPPKPAPGQPGTHSDFIPTEPEIFLAIFADGRVMAFNGHVDLGTGIRTSLAQIVAEELEIPCSRIDMILGHPFDVPNQGPTIASATIQITADPLRRAAAQAREYLVGPGGQSPEPSSRWLAMQPWPSTAEDTKRFTRARRPWHRLRRTAPG